MKRYCLLPYALLPAGNLNASAQLPILELTPDQLNRRLRRTQDFVYQPTAAPQTCSFGPCAIDLPINQWSLYQAAVKTELTRSWTDEYVFKRAIGLAIYHGDMLDWSNGQLRADQESCRGIETSSMTAHIGRLGEAIAYLTMISKGYVYWDRLDVLVKRVLANETVTHRDQIKRKFQIEGVRESQKMNDFIFENRDAQTALAEAKASVVRTGKAPANFKKILQHGLDQCAAWQDRLNPQPAQSFAIGTYFRTVDDRTDPSLIMVVDPPGDGESFSDSIDISDDAIRRGNYGAWLIGMGLTRAGETLRQTGRKSDKPSAPVELPIFNVNGSDFAVVPRALILAEELSEMLEAEEEAGVPVVFPVFSRRSPAMRLLSRTLFGFYFGPPVFHDREVEAIEVFGIEVETLRLIENRLAGKEKLQSHQPIKMFSSKGSSPNKMGFGEQNFVGSVLPDGSMVGRIDARAFKEYKTQEFSL